MAYIVHNGPPVKQLTGRTIARNHRSASERAALAAMIILGERDFTQPTHKQIAKLFGVSTAYVEQALKLGVLQRAWMAMGHLQLADTQFQPSDNLLRRTIAAAGVDRTWNALEPLI